MSSTGQSELKAIIASQIEKLQSLYERVPALPVWDMETQNESGLEVNRVLTEQAEINADAELRSIDLLRSFAGLDELSGNERRDYRLARRDDYSDLTHASIEVLNAEREYIAPRVYRSLENAGRTL